ncbi:MAG: biotin synthase BioB [Christensenellales bacterium]|jgi:biotin synthase
MKKAEILEVLKMPREAYLREVAPKAREAHASHRKVLTATAMLGFDNVCRNRCLYCGMRAGSRLPRYRMRPEEILTSVKAAVDGGFHRVFLISGEDPNYGFEKLLDVVSSVHGLGVHLSMACGEFEREEYKALREAGADAYVLKFEMGQEDIFNRLNPSTTFRRRLERIETLRELGFEVASGGIIDYPGQTLSMLAEDILLTKALGISWAPVIPYLPVPGTPLAEEGGPGSVDLCQRTISLLRLMMPEVRITAQQPGPDPQKGLSDTVGNLEALAAGGDMLFCDLLTEERAGQFSVVENRVVLGLEHIRDMAERSGMPLSMV